MTNNKNYEYQVGGSLTNDAPSYVVRQADSDLYNALSRGEFCYIFNSRQMGKSSLRVRVKHRLQAKGFSCASIDLTRLGSENLTSVQWYKGIISELWRGFGLIGKVNLKTWLHSQLDLSPIQRLSQFIEEILLVKVPGKIFIFIDEIDSVKSLKFPTDDFFALIRFCYNRRTENPEYNRLTFALFGVATPSDLIADRNRTPFNIGRGIELRGFEMQEVQPLIEGLEGKVDNPQAVLKEILYWSGGQPFLTQKLCQMVLENRGLRRAKAGNSQLPGGKLTNSESPFLKQLVREALAYHTNSAVQISTVVQSQIIENWEIQDEPEHLKTIRDRLLRNEQRTGQLLGFYRRILTTPSKFNGQSVNGVAVDESWEQTELLLSGLVIKHNGYLRVSNRIYQGIFNLEWVEKHLRFLRPYSQTFEAWIASGQQDRSRLLRGQALKDAQIWSRDKSLSDLDYQFLAVSQELEQWEAQKALEIEKEAHLILAKANQTLTEAQEKAQQTIRRSLIGLAITSMAVLILLGLAELRTRQIASQRRRAAYYEIEALLISSEALLNTNQTFNALLESLRVGTKLQAVPWAKTNTKLQHRVKTALQEAIYWVREVNRLQGHEDAVMSVSFSPDGQTIATASWDTTVKLWRRDGEELQTLFGHQDEVWSVSFSPDGERIATASWDKTVKLWSRDG